MAPPGFQHLLSHAGRRRVDRAGGAPEFAGHAFQHQAPVIALLGHGMQRGAGFAHEGIRPVGEIVDRPEHLAQQVLLLDIVHAPLEVALLQRDHRIAGPPETRPEAKIREERPAAGEQRRAEHRGHRPDRRAERHQRKAAGEQSGGEGKTDGQVRERR